MLGSYHEAIVWLVLGQVWLLQEAGVYLGRGVYVRPQRFYEHGPQNPPAFIWDPAFNRSFVVYVLV